MTLAKTAIADEVLPAVFGKGVALRDGPHELAGGTMHPSFALDVDAGGRELELVVRTTVKGRGDLSVAALEFTTIKAALACGVPAPPVHGYGETSAGDAYLVMGRVNGETSPRPLLQAPEYETSRRVIVGQLAEALANIHRVQPSSLTVPLRSPDPGQDPFMAECQRLQSQYEEDRVERHPVLEWGLRWLTNRLAAEPASTPTTTLVHGDFRVGNIMYDQHGLKAVLDWEAAHFGDPAEDLAWFCAKVWRFGNSHLEAGGLATRESWIQAYERFSSSPINRVRLALWEVAANIRWAIITLNQAKAHLTGMVQSHELLSIGRRTAETELEILRLIQELREQRHAG